jgi:hypothetical protein
MKLRRITYMLLIGILLTLAAQVVWGQDTLLAPEGVSGSTYNAAFPVTIKVDGDFSDWAQIPTVTVDKGPHPASDPAQAASLTFAAAADSDYLYLSIQVTDAHIVAGKHGIDYWNEDSVEVYLNGTGDTSLTTYVPGVAQINFPAASIGKPIGQGLLGGINFQSLGVRDVVVATPTGYAIEASIPLHTDVWTIKPQDKGSIGFQVDLNSASQADRDVKLAWSSADQTADQSYQNPSVFGQLIFTQIAGRAIAPTAVPSAGFTVKGSTILDPNGNPFVAKGTNVNGALWTWQRPTTPDVDMIADCWKFNLIRVNSFLFTGQIPYPQYNNNNDLDAIIQAYTSKKIVVVLEAHDRIGSYYTGDDLTALVSWFTDLARRYRDNPYVWFDISNEPGGRRGIDADQWVNMHGKVVEAIRNTAQANNIIIVEGAFGGQDAGNMDGNPVTESAILQHGQEILNYNGQSYNNIVFSIHTYDLWNFGDAKMADFFDRVHAQNMALIVGEYGVATGQDTQPAAQAVFDTAPSRGVGRIVWQWDGGDNNDLTVNTSQGGGWEIDNCQNPTNLSWLGQQVWKDNHTP